MPLTWLRTRGQPGGEEQHVVGVRVVLHGPLHLVRSPLLIHVVLRRRGLAPRVLPPVSLVLATWSRVVGKRSSGAR